MVFSFTIAQQTYYFIIYRKKYHIILESAGYPKLVLDNVQIVPLQYSLQ